MLEIRAQVLTNRWDQRMAELRQLKSRDGRTAWHWTPQDMRSKVKGAASSALKSPLRNLNCLFGPIAFCRFCYQPLETCGRCLFRLQQQLGIVAGVATPTLGDVVAQLSAELTQRHVLGQLRTRGVRWGVRTLRKVTGALAEAMSQHRHQAQV